MCIFPTEGWFTIGISYLPDSKMVQSIPNWEESSWQFKAAAAAPWRVYSNSD